MTSTHITIDIISDIVCPWCWLGKQFLDASLEKSTDILKKKKIKIHWRPFELDAGIPQDGIAYSDYMKAKFGNGLSDQFKQTRAHLEQAGHDAGINFRFKELKRRPNTRKAHLLIRWAHGQDKGHAASEALFRAVFDELRDIGEVEVLADIANQLNMDGNLVRELLQTGRDVEEIKAEMTYFRSLGVTSVPTFIYNGSFAVSGGQPENVHRGALKKALATPVKDIMTVLNK